MKKLCVFLFCWFILQASCSKLFFSEGWGSSIFMVHGRILFPYLITSISSLSLKSLLLYIFNGFLWHSHFLEGLTWHINQSFVMEPKQINSKESAVEAQVPCQAFKTKLPRLKLGIRGCFYLSRLSNKCSKVQINSQRKQPEWLALNLFSWTTSKDTLLPSTWF